MLVCAVTAAGRAVVQARTLRRRRDGRRDFRRRDRRCDRRRDRRRGGANIKGPLGPAAPRRARGRGRDRARTRSGPHIHSPFHPRLDALHQYNA